MNGHSGWWRTLPWRMNPVILQIGGFGLHWYGLMYLAAFAVAYGLASHRLRTEKRFGFGIEELQGLMIAMILGVLIGGRLGYVLFYNLGYYLRHPAEIFLPFDFSNGWHFVGFSGMSFHGGLIGVVLASFLYARKHNLPFLLLADLIVPCVPLGYTFGRLGNFINGELYGRITASGLGMSFPSAPGSALRHPSQLYEAFFEGIVLFIALWLLRRRVTVKGGMLGFYLVGYGLLRFFIEYTREPDAQLGFVLFRLSMGQVLCLLMILAGIAWFAVLFLREKKRSGESAGA